MAAPFGGVTLVWRGVSYTIAGDQIMGAFEQIEDEVAPLGELLGGGLKKSTKIAAAFACLLRYAGAQPAPTKAEVLGEMFSQAEPSGPLQIKAMTEAVTALLWMLVPPRDVRESMAAKGAPQEGKASPAGG